MKKTFGTTAIFSILILILFPFSSFCAEVQNKSEFRFDTSGDNDNIYLNRTSINFAFDLPLKEKKMISSIFFESKRDLHRDRWYRIELGTEFGIGIYKWFYFGESFQYAWLNPGDDAPEAKTRLVFQKALNCRYLPKDKTNIQLFEEHTFNMEEGEGSRNEVGLTLLYDLTKHSKIGLGWRHVDRIHDYDSDQITTSVLFIF